MKRLLVILLLLLVPYQTGLAAVCGYCSHRAGDGGDGHALVHELGKSKSEAAVQADAPAAGHADECPLCHLGCGSAVARHELPPVVAAAAAAPPARPVLYDPSHLDRIERVPLAGSRSS